MSRILDATLETVLDILIDCNWQKQSYKYWFTPQLYLIINKLWPLGSKMFRNAPQSKWTLRGSILKIRIYLICLPPSYTPNSGMTTEDGGMSYTFRPILFYSWNVWIMTHYDLFITISVPQLSPGDSQWPGQRRPSWQLPLPPRDLSSPQQHALQTSSLRY